MKLVRTVLAHQAITFDAEGADSKVVVDAGGAVVSDTQADEFRDRAAELGIELAVEDVADDAEPDARSAAFLASQVEGAAVFGTAPTLTQTPDPQPVEPAQAPLEGAQVAQGDAGDVDPGTAPTDSPTDVVAVDGEPLNPPTQDPSLSAEGDATEASDETSSGRRGRGGRI